MSHVDHVRTRFGMTQCSKQFSQMQLTFRPGSPMVIFDRRKRPKEEGKPLPIVPANATLSLARAQFHFRTPPRWDTHSSSSPLVCNMSTGQSHGGGCQIPERVSSRHHRFGDARLAIDIYLPSNHVGQSQILKVGGNQRLEPKVLPWGLVDSSSSE